MTQFETGESQLNPQELKYNTSHEWVGLSNQGGEELAVIGITDFALEQLTDLVFMELPEAGSSVTQGQQFGEVESVKAVSPLYSPVSGQVVEVNHELVSDLEKMAADPFGQGWLLRVRLADKSELTSLLDFTAYQQQCSQ